MKKLLEKYCAGNEALLEILVSHGESVAEKALEIAKRHPEWDIDLKFLEEAALLHDIGVVRCDAPGIHCYGTEPYICHGILGAEILRAEGLEAHAKIAERHTGCGLTATSIKERNLPLPLDRVLYPISLEEQIICFADKFFSKTHLGEEKPIERIKASLAKHGQQNIEQFDEWLERFI
jgi:uncharacterized protein